VAIPTWQVPDVDDTPAGDDDGAAAEEEDEEAAAAEQDEGEDDLAMGSACPAAALHSAVRLRLR
jgi:hypothetical protein